MKNRRRGDKRERELKKRIASSASESRHGNRNGLRDIVADVIIGLALTAILLTAKWGLEQTRTYRFIEDSFYDLLQYRLSSRLDTEASKVVVVDISGMRIDRNRRDRKYDFTNRDALFALIQEIAAQQPRAIAVDLDFTPYANQREQDRRFLDACLSLGRPLSTTRAAPVSVYVGLHEAIALGPELCLGEPRFRDLATFIGFPKAKENQPRKRIAEWIEIPYEEANQLRTWYCPSLAAAATHASIAPLPEWARWALNRVTFVEGVGYKSEEFLVDYSPIDTLERNAISLQNLDSALRENVFYGKYVFIGRGKLSEDTGDKYPVPGHRSDSYAGVYVHACAAYTLLRGALFELSGKGRLLLDMALSMFVIFGVALVRYYYRSQAHSVAPDRIVALFTLVAVCLTTVVGFYVVHMTRLMWDDFVVVALALLLHRSLEKNAEEVTRRIVSFLRAG